MVIQIMCDLLGKDDEIIQSIALKYIGSILNSENESISSWLIEQDLLAHVVEIL